MEATVKWIEGLRFSAESASGHRVILDGNQGETGPSPLETVLLSVGGCSGIDVVSILQKERHNVTGCEVKISSQRREEVPRLFTHIHLHFRVSGEALSNAAVEHAVQLSADKYCSVALMLGKVVEISHSFEIIVV